MHPVNSLIHGALISECYKTKAAWSSRLLVHHNLFLHITYFSDSRDLLHSRTMIKKHKKFLPEVEWLSLRQTIPTLSNKSWRGTHSHQEHILPELDRDRQQLQITQTHMHHSDKLYALEYMSVTAVFIASFYFRKEIRLTFRNPIFLRETTAGSQVQNTHTKR
jgi:hypothetical protein